MNEEREKRFCSLLNRLEAATITAAKLGRELQELESSLFELQKETYQFFMEDNKK